MKYNKIISILLILCVASTFIGFVSAAEEIELGGLKFNIPDGYNEKSSNENKDSTGVTYIKSYENKDGDELIINIITSDLGSINLPEDQPGYSEKTINNITGVYNKDTYSFMFVEDGKLIDIYGSEEILEQVLIKD